MYTQDDIVYSIRRYIMTMLGPPWTMDPERREIADDARPAALIEIGRSATRRFRESIPQGEIELIAPLTVMLYPSLDKPRRAGRTARNLAFALQQLILVGADGPVFENGRPASGPNRIPLYDYTDYVDEGTVEDRLASLPEFPHDVLWVEDAGVNAVQDPLDEKRWSVALDCRVSWEQAGRVGPDAPLASQGLIPTVTVSE